MQGATRHMLTRLAAPAAWMVMIFALSEQTGGPTPPFAEVLRVVAHFTLYAVLALLLAWALRARGASGAALVFVLTVLYAVSDEYHQSYVAGRDSSSFDLVVDAAGAAAALALIRWRRAVSSLGRAEMGESNRGAGGTPVADE